jgi:hypothetical protein
MTGRLHSLAGAAGIARDPRFFVRVALVTATAAACGTREPVACTLIGCEDGWSVELAGTLPATYTVAARVDGAIVASVDCGPAQPCGSTVFLRGVTAPGAQLEITGPGVDLRWQVTPRYETLQPNGPGCPPICRQARVRVEV